MTTANQFNELHAFAIKNKNGETIVDYLNLQLSQGVIDFLGLYLNVARNLNACFSLALQFAIRAADNGADGHVVYTADDYRRRAHYHLSCVIDVNRADRVFDMVELWANTNLTTLRARTMRKLNAAARRDGARE